MGHTLWRAMGGLAGHPSHFVPPCPAKAISPLWAPIYSGANGRKLTQKNTQFSLSVFSPYFVWLRKGTCTGRVDSTTPPHAVVLLGSRSRTIYFCNLGWIGDTGVIIVHRTCASTRRCCHLWHRMSCVDHRDLEVGCVVRLHHPHFA